MQTSRAATAIDKRKQRHTNDDENLGAAPGRKQRSAATACLPRVVGWSGLSLTDCKTRELFESIEQGVPQRLREHAQAVGDASKPVVEITPQNNSFLYTAFHPEVPKEINENEVRMNNADGRKARQVRAGIQRRCCLAGPRCKVVVTCAASWWALPCHAGSDGAGIASVGTRPWRDSCLGKTA